MNQRQKNSRGCSRRRFIGGAFAGVVGGALAVMPKAAAADTAGPTKARRVGLSAEGAPVADPGYSAGILAEGSRVIHVSGQGPANVTADMETQMRQTFRRIASVLETQGASLADVVIIRSYFVNLPRDLPVYRKVRTEFLSKPYPASTAVGVTALARPGLMIEFEATAIL